MMVNMEEMFKGKEFGNVVCGPMLKEGSKSYVFTCFNPKFEAPRALKIFKGLYENDKQRFIVEGKVLGALVHPNIVQVYDVGLHGNQPFIEMEQIDGISVADIIKDNPNGIPASVALGIVDQVFDALTYLHHTWYILEGEERTGIIHRNICPENIIVQPNGIVKLVGFGAIKPETMSQMTQVGGPLGDDPRYQAPEQLFKKTVGPATDIYSTACVLYALLQGYSAFENHDVTVILQQKNRDDMHFIGMKNLSLLRFIKRNLRRDSSLRCPSAVAAKKEVLELLSQFCVEDSRKNVRFFINGKIIEDTNHFLQLTTRNVSIAFGITNGLWLLVVGLLLLLK